MSHASDDDLDDDDYVPDSLADFVKQADAALSEHTQMFLDEMSPTARNLSTTSSADCDTSDIIKDLQANMEKINLENAKEKEKAPRAVSADPDGYDSEDFMSPAAAHNPDNDQTYTQLKQVAQEGRTTAEMGENKTNESYTSTDIAWDSTSPGPGQSQMEQGTSPAKVEIKPGIFTFGSASIGSVASEEVQSPETNNTGSPSPQPAATGRGFFSGAAARGISALASLGTGGQQKPPVESPKAAAAPAPAPAPAPVEAMEATQTDDNMMNMDEPKSENPPNAPVRALQNKTSPTKPSVESHVSVNRAQVAPQKVVAPTSRLVQPTAAFRGHMHSTEKRARTPGTGNVRGQQRSPTKPTGMGAPPKPTGMAGPSPASQKRMYTTPTQTRSHFMQPTVSQIAHSHSKDSSEGSRSISRKREGPTVPHVSSRLMRGTASSKARTTVTSPASTLPQKREGNEDAVARARERVRQRRMQQEAKPFDSASAQFNMGAKPSRPKAKPTRERNTPRSASKIKAPHFMTPTSTSKAHHQGPNIMSMSESGNLFGRGLRESTGTTPQPASTTKHTLTVPQGPKFLQRYEANKAKQAPKRTSELEEEQMAKYHFKATQKTANNPLHTGSSAGLTKVSKRGLTKPEPFKLSSGTRSTKRKETDDGQYARTQQKSMGSAAKGRPEKKRTVTTPQPFSFAVDMKSKSSPSPNKTKRNRNSPGGFKARPVPKSTFRGPAIKVNSLASPLQSKKQGATEGNGDGNGKQELFRARPNPPTTPEPFKLESVQRHEAFQGLFQEKQEQEEREAAASRIHKALPLPESTYKPDTPMKQSP